MEQQVMCCSASIYFTCARGKMVLGQACAGAVPGLPGMGCGRCWRGGTGSALPAPPLGGRAAPASLLTPPGSPSPKGETEAQ